jgi:hypothetical protein
MIYGVIKLGYAIDRRGPGKLHFYRKGKGNKLKACFWIIDVLVFFFCPGRLVFYPEWIEIVV